MKSIVSGGPFLLSFLAILKGVHSAGSSTNLNYEPYSGDLHESSFLEQFNSTSSERWIISSDLGLGRWAIQQADQAALHGDLGLVAMDDAKKYAIYTPWQVATSGDDDEDLVIQYEVKLQNGLECGGSYIKLVDATGDVQEFDNETPYVIMFGPDKCGEETDKVHLIVKDSEGGEHQLKNPPKTKSDKFISTLYTLVLNFKNGQFEIRINGDIVRAGNLFNPKDFNIADELVEEFMDDPEDIKPEDWVDEEFIDDLEITKPEDWDQPEFIPDMKVEKPEDWQENMPKQILESKPEDWDDDEDGIWEGQMIDNPACLHHGCGEWSRPMIKNPAYKGEWVQPKKANPDYKGKWVPKKVINPNFHEQKLAVNPVSGIGIDIWTMNKGIMFDNFYLGHYIGEAESIGNFTFVPKFEEEHVVHEALVEKSREKFQLEVLKSQKNAHIDGFTWQSLSQLSFMEIYNKVKLLILFHIAEFIVELKMFMSDIVDEPFETFMQRPGEAVWFSSIILGALSTFLLLWSVLVNSIGSLRANGITVSTPKAKSKSNKKKGGKKRR